jgi:hypothetical protein
MICVDAGGRAMTTKEKIAFAVLGTPVMIATNWLFAWWVSRFWTFPWSLFSWGESFVFYGLVTLGTIMPLVAIVALFVAKESE